MATHDNLTINKVGSSKPEPDTIASYEAAAAVRDSAVQSEQGTRPTDINNIGTVRKNDNSQRYQPGYEGVQNQFQQAKFLGLTMKDVFSANTTGDGLDHFNGTHLIGKTSQEFDQEGFTFNKIIQRGQFLNIAS